MIRDSQASITLDLIRATAAQAVCVGHAIGLFGVWKWAQPPHVPYMQNVGVLVFFLLSGFVIAFTLDSKSKDRAYGFDDYLVDRFARIYSALIPALIVIAAIDFTWTTLTGETRSTFTLRAFIGNLFMLQDVPGPLRWFVIPSFGTAGQLWTLAIEWHIYIFAGAIFFLRRSPSMMLIALLSCTVPLLYLRRVPEQDFGHGVSALWLAGFVSYYAMPYIVRLPALLTVFVATVSFAAYLFLVPPELEYTRSLYPLLVAAFTGIVAFSATKRAASGTWVRVVRFMAGYSFSLYLVHNSLLKGMAKVWSGDPYVMTLVGIVAANVVSIAIAVPTEMRHKQFAKWLRSMLKMDAVPTVSASSADRLSRQTETR